MSGDEKENPKLTPEQEAAVQRSMQRAGIAQRYAAGRSLKEFGKPGQNVIDLIRAQNFHGFIKDGGGFSITGKDPNKAYEFAVMTARAMRIALIDVRVVSLITLLDYLDNSDPEDYQPQTHERFQNESAIQGFMIPRFAEPMDSLPLKRADFYKIENYLYGRMEEGFSVSVQYSGNLDKSGWWSGYFVSRLQSQNKGITLL